MLDNCSDEKIDSYLGRLRKKIDSVLLPIVAPFSRCFIMDFPSHSNVVDSAIWLGEFSFLGNAGLEVVGTSSKFAPLPNLEKDVLIIINGGGNLGDLWRSHHDYRLRVLETYRGNSIVQMPSSVFFQDEAYICKTKSSVFSHPDFKIMVRDEKSLTILRNQGISATLCPDLAYYMDPDIPEFLPQTDVVYLKRSDKESRHELFSPGPNTLTVDWTDKVISAREELFALGLGLLRAVGMLKIQTELCQLHRRARANVARGLRVLGAGRVILSDRLHANILSDVMGIPHIAIDNANGKVHDFYKTWGRSPFCLTATNEQEMLKSLFHLRSQLYLRELGMLFPPKK